MKRISIIVFGVTLLEIMLLLAVASIIIIMSVRYYQTTNQNQQINSFVEQVHAITSVADTIAKVNNSDYAGVNPASVESGVTGNTGGFNLPWGGTLTYVPNATGYELTLSVPPNDAACSILTSRLTSDDHFQVDGTCGTITYVANP